KYAILGQCPFWGKHRSLRVCLLQTSAEPKEFMADKRTSRTATHWGVYDIETKADTISSVRPWHLDPNPSPIGQSLDAVDGPTRVLRPAVRKGWLEEGPGHGRRGAEAFVEVDWDTALDLVASVLE